MKKSLKSFTPRVIKYQWLQAIYPIASTVQNKILYKQSINIKRYRSKFFKNPNVCHLKKGSNFFLINSESNKIAILDSKLNLIKSLNLNYEFEIYHSMKSADGCSFLLYDFNNCIIIYLDLLKNNMRLYDSHYIQGQLTLLYLWKEDYIILTTTNGLFYTIDLINSKIIATDQEIIQKNEPEFYAFWEYCKPYKRVIRQINFYERTLVYENEESTQLTFLNYATNEKLVVKKPITNYCGNQFHDAVYYKGLFAAISEEEILIINGVTHYQLLPSRCKYRFLRACFSEENADLYLNILSSNQSTASILTTYKIITI